MKTRDRVTKYKGLPITVRWTELPHSANNWGPHGHQFVGSYLIADSGAELGIWQHCSPQVFVSHVTAAAFALAEARRAIDANLAQDTAPTAVHGGGGTTRMTESTRNSATGRMR
jgi:hypothetical protein